MGSSNAISNDSRHNCVYRMETELWGNSVFLICKMRNLNWKKIQDFLYFSPEINRHTYAAAAKLLQLCPTLCDPKDGSPPGSPSLEFSRQEHWSGLPFPSPMHESEKWNEAAQTLSDPVDCGLPGSSRGIFQASVLEWVATAFSRHTYGWSPNLWQSRQEYTMGSKRESP